MPLIEQVPVTGPLPRNPAMGWAIYIEGVGYAIVRSDTPRDLFLGHPVTADASDLAISICNFEPGRWQVALHNPTDKPIKATIRSSANWTPFSLPPRQVEVPAGPLKEIELQMPAE